MSRRHSLCPVSHLEETQGRNEECRVGGDGGGGGGGGWGDGELAGEGRGEESAVLLIRAAL